MLVWPAAWQLHFQTPHHFICRAALSRWTVFSCLRGVFPYGQWKLFCKKYLYKAVFFPLGTEDVFPRYVAWGFSAVKASAVSAANVLHLANWGACLLLPAQKGLQHPRTFRGKRLVASFNQHSVCTMSLVSWPSMMCRLWQPVYWAARHVSLWQFSHHGREHPAGILIQWCIFLKEKSLAFLLPLPCPPFEICYLNSGMSGIKKVLFYTNLLTFAFFSLVRPENCFRKTLLKCFLKLCPLVMAKGRPWARGDPSVWLIPCFGVAILNCSTLCFIFTLLYFLLPLTFILLFILS